MKYRLADPEATAVHAGRQFPASAVIERTEQEAASLAYANYADLLDAAGNLIPIHQLPRHVTAAIASVKYDKDTGRVAEIKLWEKNAAVDRLYKQAGLFREDNKQKPGANLALQIVLVDPPKRTDIDDEE